MRILIEQLKPETKGAKDGEPYYTFWVRFYLPDSPVWVTTSGWRYWPSQPKWEKKLTSPSMQKGFKKNGEKHYFNTSKVSSEAFDLIGDEVERLLGIARPIEVEVAE